MKPGTRGEARYLEALGEPLRTARSTGVSGGGMIELGQVRAYFKYGPLARKAGLRHAMRRWIGIEYPRLNEFDNLTWLRRNGFDAPRPLAAGVLSRRGLPVFQYLACEELEGARTVRELFEGERSPERALVLERLGRDVARLHELRFIHRDLFPRNLLVTGADDGVRVHFIDAWRGGPRRGLRGPAYDLACLMLYGVELFEPEEEEQLFGAYFEARAADTDRRALLGRAAQERRALVRRLARRGRSNPPLPTREWSPS